MKRFLVVALVVWGIFLASVPNLFPNDGSDQNSCDIGAVIVHTEDHLFTYNVRCKHECSLIENYFSLISDLIEFNLEKERKGYFAIHLKHNNELRFTLESSRLDFGPKLRIPTRQIAFSPTFIRSFLRGLRLSTGEEFLKSPVDQMDSTKLRDEFCRFLNTWFQTSTNKKIVEDPYYKDLVKNL